MEKSFLTIEKSMVFNLDYETLGIYLKSILLIEQGACTIKDLSAKFKELGEPISEKRLRKSFSVLIGVGLVEREPTKGKDGKFNGWDYTFNY